MSTPLDRVRAVAAHYRGLGWVNASVDLDDLDAVIAACDDLAKQLAVIFAAYLDGAP